jgi:CDP-diacylglycerol---glycerol-3-phosphate 3-phosphatidyltransferase
VNLPNTISAARIVASPVFAALAFVPSIGLRAVAFVLYLITAISDHYDGKIAREQGLITDLGKVLDPLADKLMLVACFVPMFLLQSAPDDALLALMPSIAEASQYPFSTWMLPPVYFHWWILVPILGREAFMTWFRGFAQKRGAVIAAQRLGKFKAGFQFTWMGASFAWFMLQTITEQLLLSDNAAMMGLMHLIGGIGTVTMYVALALTLISLGDYLISYRSVFTAKRT